MFINQDIYYLEPGDITIIPPLEVHRLSNEFIAEKLDITVPTVRLCLQKFMESGVAAALEDSHGRGRKAEIFDDSKAWVVNIACQKPTAFGLAAELWYPASLTKYVNSVAQVQMLSISNWNSVLTKLAILSHLRRERQLSIHYLMMKSQGFRQSQPLQKTGRLSRREKICLQL